MSEYAHRLIGSSPISITHGRSDSAGLTDAFCYLSATTLAARGCKANPPASLSHGKALMPLAARFDEGTHAGEGASVTPKGPSGGLHRRSSGALSFNEAPGQRARRFDYPKALRAIT